MFRDIGLRHGQGFTDRGTDPLAEPRLHTQIKEYGGKQGHDNSRGYRHQTEHGDKAGMQARTRRTGPARHP